MNDIHKFKVSLCIPTMNRWSFLKENIPRYLENPYIEEIIICDETGDDVNLIREHIQSNKIHLYTNEKILGAYLNKRKVVSLAKNDFVCLMDSDNFAPVSYFDSWKNFCGENPDPSVVYCALREGYPGSLFDYSQFRSIFINKKNCKELFHKGLNGGFFNDGNYIVSKHLYMVSEIPTGIKHFESECYAADVVLQNYNILVNGGSLCIVPLMEYDHVFHSGSYWSNTHHLVDFNKYMSLISEMRD